MIFTLTKRLGIFYRFLIFYIKFYFGNNKININEISLLFKDKLYSNDKIFEIERIRKECLNNKTLIEVLDLGAGSHSGKTKIRRINQIAKNSLKSEKLCRLIYRLASYNKSKKIVEFGTSFGISTMYLAEVDSVLKVISIEGCPNTAKIAYRNFLKTNQNKIKLIINEFSKALEDNLIEFNNVDFIYIDGNHQYQATIEYYEFFKSLASNDSIFLFDDINWSKGMRSAWKKIKTENSKNLIVETPYFGIIFFNSTFKGHFLANY